MDIHPLLITGIKVVNTGMASGTLWARLEGERHYPSDILAGYAVGSFVAGFVFDSLMNLEEGESFSVLPVNDLGLNNKFIKPSKFEHLFLRKGNDQS